MAKSKPVDPYKLTKPQIAALESTDRFGHFHVDPRVGGRLQDLGLAKRVSVFRWDEFFITEAGEAWRHELRARAEKKA